ncbi:MAG: ATP-binding protein, partial [Ginsengibacter sp.]
MLSTSTFAQQPVFNNLQHFTTDDGLPQSFISGITQDKDGFIWISTLDGLARYDGRKFRLFRYKYGDTAGVRANTIYNMAPIVNNHISLFYDGLMADDFDMQTFKVTSNNSRSFLQNLSKNQSEWGNGQQVSGNWYFLKENFKGIGWASSHTGKINYANQANGLLEQDTVFAVTEGSDGRAYFISANGVQISDPGKSKFNFLQFNTGLKSFPPTAYETIFYPTNIIQLLPGNKIALLIHNRLIILDITNKTSTPYIIPQKNKNVPGDEFRILKQDNKGQVYFADGNCIYMLTTKGELKLLWQNIDHPELNITSLFIDRTDVLWVSVNAQGLLKIDLQSLPFHSFLYKSSFIADIMEMALANKSTFPVDWLSLYSSYSFRQAYNKKGDLFVSYNSRTINDVFYITNEGFKQITYRPDSTLYGAMLVMPNNELWAFDEANYRWYTWKSPQSVPEKLQLDAKSMKGMQIADAKFIDGYIWMSTYAHGLLQYDGAKLVKRFTGPNPIPNMPRDLTEICPDPVDKNKFWVGSRGGGLILWDVNKGLQKIYTTNDGLPNNTIYCILPDKNGKIWCSTNKGIFRLDTRTGHVTSFEKADGLAGNEFNRAHKFSFSDGRLAFGGMDGFTIFDPAEFDQKKISAKVPVEITSFQINNELQGIGNAGSILKESLSTISFVELPYDKNYLRIEFAALVFNNPQKIKYRYQLVNVDKDWIESGNNNQAAYAALRQGKYILKINATDNNGLWSPDKKEITIIINPPFWLTWWAYLIYALILLGLIRWYVVFREQRIKDKQNLAFEKREALRLRETDEMKDRFFSNITHEFRTPLTLIISPLDKLSKDNSLSAAAIASLNTAHKNSLQLLKLINELLDFSKLNSGKMKVNAAAGEFNLFVEGLIQPFRDSAKEKNINFSFKSSGIDGYYLFDEEKWQKIVNNLLSNALKFTPKNGEITLLLTSSSTKTMILEVIDNGPGIPGNLQQKVFDRFYQVDNSTIRNYGGTGIGLSLVKELTQLMNGAITLESTPGSSTRFIVEIPLEKVETQQLSTG